MKKFVSAAAAVTFALSLAACGGSSDADEEVIADDVETPANEPLADIDEAPVEVEPVPAAQPAGESREARRATLDEAGDSAQDAADDVEAAIAAEFEDAEEALDAEAQ